MSFAPQLADGSVDATVVQHCFNPSAENTPRCADELIIKAVHSFCSIIFTAPVSFRCTTTQSHRDIMAEMLIRLVGAIGTIGRL